MIGRRPVGPFLVGCSAVIGLAVRCLDDVVGNIGRESIETFSVIFTTATVSIADEITVPRRQLIDLLEIDVRPCSRVGASRCLHFGLHGTPIL